MKDNTNALLVREIEAVLFASGEPVSITRLAQACQVTEKAALAALETLAAEYEQAKRAICIQPLGDSWQMMTLPAYDKVVRQAMETKKSVPLSVAAMEVLTIVAYNQPVSKSFVEHVRGVDSSSVVNSLVEKELLMEVGRLDVPGKPIAYGTTTHFLRCFGLSSLDDLPPLTTLQTPSPEDETPTTDDKTETTAP